MEDEEAQSVRTKEDEEVQSVYRDHNYGNLLELLVEIWCKILLEHTIMKELIRFSAVQTSWKSIAMVIVPHQIPWLIVLINPKKLLTLDFKNAFHQQFLEGLNHHLQNTNHQFLHNHLDIVNAFTIDN